jgi:hypothetical protein
LRTLKCNNNTKAPRKVGDVKEGETYRDSKDKWHTVVTNKVDVEEEGAQ